ncbi:MAG: hypothetical protein NUW37_13540 [Planctomycetes bacterium]|nr:hypothetical protein [Planctomycetota bacterium]
MVAPIEKPNLIPLDFRPSYYGVRMVEETPASVGARMVQDKHVREKAPRPAARRRRENREEPIIHDEVEVMFETPPSESRGMHRLLNSSLQSVL